MSYVCAYVYKLSETRMKTSPRWIRKRRLCNNYSNVSIPNKKTSSSNNNKLNMCDSLVNVSRWAKYNFHAKTAFEYIFKKKTNPPFRGDFWMVGGRFYTFINGKRKSVLKILHGK